MKKRLISISVGLVLLAFLMWQLDTVAVNVAFAVIGAIGVFEITRALGLNDNKLWMLLFGLLHVWNMLLLPNEHYFVYALLFVMFCLVMFLKNRHYTFKEAGGAFAATIMLTMGLRSILVICAESKTVWDARFMFFMGLALGWLCDTLAFTFGHWLGKKKLCPTISPNKTVAGAVGGILGTPVLVVLLYWWYASSAAPDSAFYGKLDVQHFAFFAVLGLLGAIVGIIGDLSASYIKRECGIKDFGNIMPGHGGVIDRLDSVLFTCTLAACAYELYLGWFCVNMP